MESAWWPTTTSRPRPIPPAPCWSGDPMGASSRSRWHSPSCMRRAATTWCCRAVRGTFGSGGVFEPMVNEADDGADTVVWLREQPWFGVGFATVGLSLSGIHPVGAAEGSAAGTGRGRHHRGPHDFNASVWAPGRSRSTTFWAGAIWFPTQEDPGSPQGRNSPGARPAASCAGPCEVADGNRGPEAARHWCTLVRIVGRAPRAGTIRSGTGYGSPPRWRGCGCQCCSWVAGKTFSSGKTLQQYQATCGGPPIVRDVLRGGGGPFFFFFFLTVGGPPGDGPPLFFADASL